MTSTYARPWSRPRANPRSAGRHEPSLSALKSNGPHVAAITGLRADSEIFETLQGVLVAAPSQVIEMQHVERLQFEDGRLALDIHGDGHAGAAARTMIAVLGTESLANEKLLGTVISYVDAGFTVGWLCEHVIESGLLASLAGDASNAAFVQYVYQNIFGWSPDPIVAASLVALLDDGEVTQGQLLAVGVDHDVTRAVLTAYVGLPFS